MSNNPNIEAPRFYTDLIPGGRIVVRDSEDNDRICGYPFDDEEEAVKYLNYLARMHR